MTARYDFRGKKALVTGAADGIGRDLALLLVDCGATVFAADVDEVKLNELISTVRRKDTSNNIHPIVCDMGASHESIESAVAACLPVDFLVNNAGITITEPFLDVKADSFERVMSVNVRGILYVSQLAARAMIEHSIRGVILHHSSVASRVSHRSHTVYCMSKAALDAMARVMAVELGAYGIRVNCVNPTVVMTDMGRRVWGDAQKAKPLLNRTPMGHFAEMNDVSKAILFLFSDQSTMTTGASLPVDGGLWAT